MSNLYVGTKVVSAAPQEKDGQPGYAVTYKDGYTSWSPAAAFEEAYKPLSGMYPGLGDADGDSGESVKPAEGEESSSGGEQPDTATTVEE